MKSIKPERLTLEAEFNADIAMLSAIAEVKLATLRQYQAMLVTLRRGNKPRPHFARTRLLFECKEERCACLDTLEAIAVAKESFAKWNRSEGDPA